MSGKKKSKGYSSADKLFAELDAEYKAEKRKKMLTLHTTGQFRKDEKLARKRGLNISLLKEVI